MLLTSFPIHSARPVGRLFARVPRDAFNRSCTPCECVSRTEGGHAVLYGQSTMNMETFFHLLSTRLQQLLTKQSRANRLAPLTPAIAAKGGKECAFQRTRNKLSASRVFILQFSPSPGCPGSLFASMF